MALASDIITAAYRESNLIPMGNTPNTNQQTEGLDRLNRLLASTIGNEAGDAFEDLNIGGNFDETWDTLYYIPSNIRLVLNLNAALTLKLHPQPFEGQRLSVIDAAGNCGSYPLTLLGNGRTIENGTSLVCNTNGFTRNWFYRADLGSWIKVTNLAYGDTMPYPQDFDDYFITMLAMRLNPMYGQSIAPETEAALKRARSWLRDRYHAWKQMRPDYDGRGLLNDTTYAVSPNTSDFDTGRPYRWR